MDALNYVIDQHGLLNLNQLKVFYGFNPTDSYQIGTSYLINSLPPASNTGAGGIIVGASSPTNVNNFLSDSGNGSFSYHPLRITGDIGANANNTTMVFSFENESSQEGMLFGSYKKFANGKLASSGYNFGINAVGKMFFEHRGLNGDYALTANSINLSKKNLVSLHVGSNEVEFSRYDYNNDRWESESFSVQTSSIYNSNENLIGDSPTYYNASNARFQGKIDNFLIFSGSIPKKSIFQMGSGLYGNYSYTAPSQTGTSQIITGYERTFLYPTGVTGYSVTYAYDNVEKSGAHLYISEAIELSPTSFDEGEIYITGQQIGSDYFSDFRGYIKNTGNYDYAPTGDDPYSTLGLSNRSISHNQFVPLGTFTSQETTGFMRAVISPQTGYLSEPTGFSETALTTTRTGYSQGSSGISMIDSTRNQFQFNYFHFLGYRDV